MRSLVAMLLWSVPCVASAYTYLWTIGIDVNQLGISRTDGKTISAPRLPGQIGYEKAFVSSTGRYVGWIATFGGGHTWDTSGTTLVVMNERGKTLAFEGNKEGIENWCFTPNEQVVFRQVPDPRRDQPMHIERRRLSDGKLIASGSLPRTSGYRPNEIPHPAWAKCLMD